MVMTKVTAAPIPSAESMRLETPRKGQIPKNWVYKYGGNKYRDIGEHNQRVLSVWIIAIKKPSAINAPGARIKMRDPYSSG